MTPGSIITVITISSNSSESKPQIPFPRIKRRRDFLKVSHHTIHSHLETVILVNPANAYIFGYESDDGLGTTQHRHEVADGSGVVKGSYGYRDSFGVFRSVNYTADGNGYRAVVRSNEPGFTGQSSSDVVYVAEPPVPIRAPPLAVRVKKSEK
ncbi:cuticle protein 10.9 [Trichonephila clavata]|uniref:Cuticle protein 10.9 n=1 Tax=Trichonephila clavata TaxID=2740835 RepID=A0A8X6FE72_TRICU|nr:cuticle protein 10.9 [Trichonephila clavata]